MRNATAQRHLLLQFIRRPYSAEGLPVNRRHCWNTRHPLIQRLIKKGMVRQVRTYDHYGHGITRLIPSDGRLEDGPVTCPECSKTISTIWRHEDHSLSCGAKLSPYFTR